jgi:hypothetical protein
MYRCCQLQDRVSFLGGKLFARGKLYVYVLLWGPGYFSQPPEGHSGQRAYSAHLIFSFPSALALYFLLSVVAWALQWGDHIPVSFNFKNSNIRVSSERSPARNGNRIALVSEVQYMCTLQNSCSKFSRDL